MKDPAVLFYISDWLTSTAEMDADCRGWYLNLILHQYDKKDLPNDIENLAVLAGVKFSEYDRFKQVFEQVLKQKFKQTESGRLANDKAKEILQKRERFVEKRINSGKIGYLVKVIHEITSDSEEIEYLKDNFDFEENDIKDKQVLKQVLKQMLKLYRNGNENRNKDIYSLLKKVEFPENLEEVIKTWLKYKSEKKQSYKEQGLKTFIKKLTEFSGGDPETAMQIIEQSMANNWAGIFELKTKSNEKTWNDTKGGFHSDTTRRTIEAVQRGIEQCG
jgi:hypothetical protein